MTVLPLLVTAVLLIYPNVLALCAARWRWNQWRVFTRGNALLGLICGAATWASGNLAAVWGTVDGRGAVLGVMTGLLPLLVVVALIIWTDQLGRDLVAAGIGDLAPGQFLYRLSVQVALTTVIVEEVAFRGVLHLVWLRSTTVPWAVGIDAVTYGLWHMALQYNGFASQTGLRRWAATAGGTVVYIVLGVVLALLRQVSGGLLAPLLAHGTLDLLMFCAMAVRRRQIALTDTTDTGPSSSTS